MTRYVGSDLVVQGDIVTIKLRRHRVFFERVLGCPLHEPYTVFCCDGNWVKNPYRATEVSYSELKAIHDCVVRKINELVDVSPHTHREEIGNLMAIIPLPSA